MIGFIGILLSLCLLIYLAYRGWSVILLAPILALLATTFSLFEGGEVHLLATYTETFMSNAANYVKNYYPVFLLGALFGKVMDDTGTANSIAMFIAKKVGKGKEIWAIVIAGGIIVYGGVSMFVAAFALYPIGAALFREANIPKRLLPATIGMCTLTFSMSALPGSPQIQNAIPMKYLGTDLFAAPVLGIIAALIMFFGGTLWIISRAIKAKKAGEGYGNHPNENLNTVDSNDLPSFGTAIIPILIVLVGNFVLSKIVFPGMDFTYLQDKYNIAPSAVLGNWSLILSLIVAIAFAISLNVKRFKKGIMSTLKEGVQGSFLAIMNTASEVGYGNVIKTLAAFGIVGGALMGISSNPLVTTAISSSVLAGITGSASGGVSIALEAFGQTFMDQAMARGIDIQVLHRVAAVACGGLDSLPHNGAVITLLGITGMTHKESYAHLGMVTVVIPTFAAIAIVALGSLGIV
ncbi:GntP family permease [Anaerotignum propionicum]|uniref:Citrate transporter n=1 Tax=Anaerotignum propionicum DSM 1682 TaxID=991789 RepID=A0A0X1U8F2_ANAPI|nr:GntP family permease [Anaerotignum propionicum]AMJ41205.1 citrate transporter [Anaerotignum propionicum DSM 1682]SHF12458.1 H+/gluconate symporter [[Clostridium] propionicum DSM 1682] [Anaerotignum propionicum DSM 1682]